MKKKKKLRLRTKIILIITSLILAVAAGFGAFLIIGASQGQAEIEESEAQYKTTLIEAPTDGSLPTDHNPMDVIAYSLWTVANTSEFKVTTTGTANALIATQQISNSRVVKDGKAMISTVSSGMVNVAKQRYFSDGKVLLRDPEKIDGVNVLWKDQIPECITYNQNIKRYGWLPFQANGYIICEDTYLNKDAIELIDNNDGTYLIKFDLDPADDKAPFWYRREVLTNASSQMVPRFESIHMEFTIDAKYRILKQDIQEKYTVKSMGIEAGTTTDCHDVFEYDNITYSLTEYNKSGVEENLNSDVILTTEDNKNTSKTNALVVKDKNLKNIDIGLVENELVDLEINKYINKVIVSNSEGTTTYDYNKSKTANVSIGRKVFNGSTVVVEYAIDIKNNGDIPTYAKSIKDVLPKELTFNTELNNSWFKENDGTLNSVELAQEVINPGETKTIVLIASIVTKDKAHTLVNNAKIGEMFNSKLIQEKDTKNNESQASLLITVNTGNDKIYLALVIAVITIIGAGIMVINKRILLK